MPIKLGLGTAQFGLNYGATNRIGVLSDLAISELLALAPALGIDFLDTAPSYGDAEEKVGRLAPTDNPIEIIIKSAVFGGIAQFSSEDVAKLTSTLHRSLDLLHRDNVDAFLIHHGSDLLLPGGDRLIAALEEFKADGLVKRIGASAYNAAEIEGIVALFTPDLLQLPISIADQRLIRSGQLDALNRAGIQVHARSVFLQGLLLSPPDQLPARVSPIAEGIRNIQEASAESGILKACLGFVSQQSGIEAAIVGITTIEELREIAAAISDADQLRMDFDALAIEDDWYLHPGNWQRQE